MKIKTVLLILFTIIFLASCAPLTETVQPEAVSATSASVSGDTTVSELTSTPQATSTVTPVPDTPTPAIPDQPTLEVSLSGDNNAGMVYENDAWVVKNTNGEVTATWDGTKWTYNTEAITVNQTIIGFDGQDVSLLDTLLATPLDETTLKYFTDPANGLPLPYGYVRKDKLVGTSTEDQTYEIPISFYAVRMLGTVVVSDTHNAIVLELPLAADRSIIFTFDEYVGQGALLYGLSEENLSQETSFLELPAVLFDSTTMPDLFNVDLRGQEMLMAIYHDIPDTLSVAYVQWSINANCAALLQFIDDPAATAPPIDAFSSDLVMPPFWNGTLWVPDTVVVALQAAAQ